jgi:hypothetical protein
MPTKVDQYREQIRATRDVDRFLSKHSGLPGPRGNLELAHAFAREADRREIWRLADLGPDEAPENTPEGFQAFCGVLGLGRLMLEGDPRASARLRQRASDPRWRVREAVATALQLVGDGDPKMFSENVVALVRGNPLEQRAAVAAVAEPRLLEDPAAVRSAIRILDKVTRSLTRFAKPLGEEQKVLRQALAYAWSVVVAAEPSLGKPAMETWLHSTDPDVVWLMTQNLAKNRLRKADAAWSQRWVRALRSAKAGRRGSTIERPPPRGRKVP